MFKKIFTKNKIWNPLNKKIIKDFNKTREISKRKYLCHAPFKSLCFSHSGDILACWYNKMYPLGKYPNDKIKDIWFSERAKKLREHILHNDLNFGCYDCKRNIENKFYHAQSPYRYDFLPDTTSKYPVSMDFQISEQCNLKCIMCNGEYSTRIRQERENKKMIQSPYDDVFYEQLKEFIPHLKEASFSGGEPFVGSKFFKIWDLMIELNTNIKLSITTNGNVLNDKVKYYLNKLSFHITLSLDTINPEIYKNIRIGGDLNIFLHNFDWFYEYAKNKSTYFNVKTCVMQQNWHDLPDLAEFLNKRNVPFLYNNVFYPPNASIWNLSSTKLSEIKTYLENNFVFHNQSIVQSYNAETMKGLLRQIDSWQKQALYSESFELNKMTTKELEKFLLNNFKTFILNEQKENINSYPFSYLEIEKIITKLVQDTKNEYLVNNGLIYFCKSPVEKIISEFRIRNYETIKDRFIQACKFTC
ncbi:MAG TPA: radical SAM protein [Bacteroidales bacterium]|jgi:MoaA/NifB/PqqE/SkfB family radical SAM enzyme|nr:radical SAM protein [Bacteroidales bacterium]HNY45059.1 radical SAM protein [Bacteroidales bacterium]HOD88906.1 radical SAM protein [Bacteroidales bacterium]HOE38275.1 radical SAM protein [Bacteroidales bacterium]HPL03992.1 radical SAM protein [Bacteroidales bacterium]